MKLTLIGYGKMGKAIEEVALARGHQIHRRIDIDSRDRLTAESMEGTDVALEFTQPDAAFQNISTCLEMNIPVVSGTTGWHDRMDEIIGICKRKSGSLFYASNYSIGVNIMFFLNRKLARLMEQQEDYEPFINEIHHIHKKDAPSGTAVSLAKDLLENLSRKNNWQLGRGKEKETLYITAVRENEVPGTHEVKYESGLDELIITHRAKSRMAFARGAVAAAEFLKDKKGIYTMEDLLRLGDDSGK